MTPIQLAEVRSRRLYKSGQFRGAYVSGARAALAGTSVESCPYRNERGWRAWRRAWMLGHRSVAE